MARPNIQRGTFVTVLMGNGATPTEVFSVLCGLTAKSITDQINTDDQYVRDCADPDEVPWREIIATGRLFSIRASGVLNRDQFDDFNDAMGDLKHYRFFIGKKTGETGTPLNGYYGGEAMLTNKVITGDDGTLINVEVSIESNGPWTWTDVP